MAKYLTKNASSIVSTNVLTTPVGQVAATNLQAAIQELDAETVKLTGNQSIAGLKTFTNDSFFNTNKVTLGKTGASTIVNSLLLNTGFNEAPFSLSTAGGNFAGEFDPVLYYGFNYLGAGGGKVIPNVPSLWWGMESRFVNNGITAFEDNLDYQNADGTINRRFSYFLCDRVDGTKALWWHWIGLDASSRYMILDENQQMKFSVEGSQNFVRIQDGIRFELTSDINPYFINQTNQKPYLFIRDGRGSTAAFNGVVANSFVACSGLQDTQLTGEGGSITADNRFRLKNTHSIFINSDAIQVSKDDNTSTQLILGNPGGGTGDTEIRLQRGGPEHLKISANAGGVSGLDNAFCFDVVANAQRDVYFRRVNSSLIPQVQWMRLTWYGTTMFNTPIESENTTASTSPSTGSAVFKGGIGVSGSGWFGGDVRGVNGAFSNAINTLTVRSNNSFGTNVNGQTLFFNSGNGTGTGALAPIIFSTPETTTPGTNSQNSSERMRLSGLGNLLIGTTTDNATDKLQVAGSGLFTGQLKVTNTTPSTSTTTGCATFAGGVGVAQNIFCGGSVAITNGRASVNTTIDSTALFSIQAISSSAGIRIRSFSNHTANHFEALNFAGNTVFSVGNSGQITTSNTTPSTSTTTGALLIGGGIGVSGAGYFLNEVSSRSILVGENAVKTSITSTDNGSINEVFIGRQSVGGSILSVPNPVTMGAADNEIRLYRAGSSTVGEYLRLLAPRGGASGQNNIFLFDIVGSSVPTTRPLRFRFINTTGATTDALQLHNTGRVSINSTVDNGVDQLQVSGSTISTQYKLSALNTAPASSTAPGTLGEIRFTPTGINLATATNTWRRVSLQSPRQTLTPTGTTQTINWTNGESVDLNLGSASGNVTLTLSNPAYTVATYLIKVIQTATPRNIIFPAGTLQAGGGGNIYTGVANSTHLIAVYWDGSNYFINPSGAYS